MSGVMGFVMVENEIRQVPKWGMTLAEVAFAVGSPDLVDALRRIGELRPIKRMKRLHLFDAGDVARVWAGLKAGEYDEKLRAIGKID